MSSLINRHIAHLLWSDLLYFDLAEYIIFFAIDLFTTRIYNTITKKNVSFLLKQCGTVSFVYSLWNLI